MPPKAPIIRQQSASPIPAPPPAPGPSQVPNDLLVIQDIVDTLDAMPGELTRALGDLRELDAVLTATLLSLNEKLVQLISWIQDDSVSPAKRFQLLQEIAEEAARFKLGGDDKIRVAGGACDGIMNHQKHISNLLAASTLLVQGPPSPYTQSLTLGYVPPQSTTRRGVAARTANSPFGGRGYAAGGALGLTETRETPTKKKKNRVQQLGMGSATTREDDEVSVAGRDKKPAKKRRPAARAISPTDSVASTAGYNNKPPEIARTARQIAAAAARAKVNQAVEESEDDEHRKPTSIAMAISPSVDSMAERRDGGPGLDLDSREGSLVNGKSGNPTPIIPSSGPVGGGAAAGSRPGRVRGIKRSRNDEEDEDDDDEEQREERPAVKRIGNGNVNGIGNGGGGGSRKQIEVDVTDHEGGQENDPDMKTYCTCGMHSFGEMIGCDETDCEIEWYHLACLGLDRPPEGNWICPKCVERKKKNSKAKKNPRKRGGN